MRPRLTTAVLVTVALGGSGIFVGRLAAHAFVDWRAALTLALALAAGAVIGVLGMRIWTPHWLVAMANFNVTLLEEALRDECAIRRDVERQAAVAAGENIRYRFEVSRLKQELVLVTAERDDKSDELRRRDIAGEVSSR